MMTGIVDKTPEEKRLVVEFEELKKLHKQMMHFFCEVALTNEEATEKALSLIWIGPHKPWRRTAE